MMVRVCDEGRHQRQVAALRAEQARDEAAGRMPIMLCWSARVDCDLCDQGDVIRR